MNQKKLKIIYTFLTTLLIIIINSGTIFFLISQLIDINIYTLDLSEWGRSTREKLELLMKVDQYSGDLRINFWELINGWRAFLVWISIVGGWASTFLTIIKIIQNSLKRKRDKNDKKEDFEILKMKLKADFNQLTEKDIKKMEKQLYE